MQYATAMNKLHDTTSCLLNSQSIVYESANRIFKFASLKIAVKNKK